MDLTAADNATLDAKVIELDHMREQSTKWLDDCICGETGKPLPVLANALIGLRAVFPDSIAYDEMLCAPMLMQPLQGDNDFTPRPLTDVDVGIIQKELQHLGLSRIGSRVLFNATEIERLAMHGATLTEAEKEAAAKRNPKVTTCSAASQRDRRSHTREAPRPKASTG